MISGWIWNRKEAVLPNFILILSRVRTRPEWPNNLQVENKSLEICIKFARVGKYADFPIGVQRHR
jgi:hypothetical protein